MSRIPDYEQMRVMVATAEAENINGNDLIEILYSGYDGYKYDGEWKEDMKHGKVINLSIFIII